MIDLLGLNVLQKFVLSHPFLVVGLNELKVQVQLSLIISTQPPKAQIRVGCQKEIQRMFKLGLKVMPSDDEKQLEVASVHNYQISAIITVK